MAGWLADSRPFYLPLAALLARTVSLGFCVFMLEGGAVSISSISNLFQKTGATTQKTVFCKPFLAKVAKYFWRTLHLHFGKSCSGQCRAFVNRYRPLQTLVNFTLRNVGMASFHHRLCVHSHENS